MREYLLSLLTGKRKYVSDNDQEGGPDKQSASASKERFAFNKRLAFMVVCFVMLSMVVLSLVLVCLLSTGDVSLLSHDGDKTPSTIGVAEFERSFERLHARANSRKTLVGMITVNRADVSKSVYIYQTLASLLPAMGNNLTTSTYTSYTEHPTGVRIFVGSTERSYLRFLSHNSNVKIVEMSEEEWAPIKSKSVHQRASYNYYRMIEYLIQVADDETPKSVVETPPKPCGLLLFEDDVIVSHDASERLDAVVADIEAALGATSDFILSGYFCEYHVSSIFAFPEGRLFTPYVFDDAYGWCCTQSIYMPLRTARKLAPWLESYLCGKATPFIPYDNQIALFSLAHGIPILAMRDPFTQHIGKDSTGLGASFHRGFSDVQIDEA